MRAFNYAIDNVRGAAEGRGTAARGGARGAERAARGAWRLGGPRRGREGGGGGTWAARGAARGGARVRGAASWQLGRGRRPQAGGARGSTQEGPAPARPDSPAGRAARAPGAFSRRIHRARTLTCAPPPQIPETRAGRSTGARLSGARPRSLRPGRWRTAWGWWGRAASSRRWARSGGGAAAPPAFRAVWGPIAAARGAGGALGGPRWACQALGPARADACRMARAATLRRRGSPNCALPTHRRRSAACAAPIPSHPPQYNVSSRPAHGGRGGSQAGAFARRRACVGVPCFGCAFGWSGRGRVP